MIVDSTIQTSGPQFRVLSDPQIEKLYQATLQCLERTGIHVLNDEARTLLSQAGAQVEGVRVRIPPAIVQEAVAAAPTTFTLWGRNGTRKLDVGPGANYFGPGPTCTNFVDPETGERRRTRRGDPGLTARVCDALDHIDYVMSLGLIDVEPPSLAPVYEFAEMVANTTKPVLPWGYSRQNAADIYDIALAVAGDEASLRRRPFFAFFATYQSPLVQIDKDLANAMYFAERGIPIVMLGGGAAGSTAPITGAGTLVVSLAGALTSLSIIQLKVPGAAVCIGIVPEAMDLRTCRPSYGSPEMSLYGAAVSEIAQTLGLPFMGTAGASEAKVLDQQAAIESTMQVILSALSGASLVHDVGFLDCADVGSLEMLIMNNEIIAMTRRVMRGIEISDESLMLDLIDQVGPGGEFVSAVETARRCRTEIWNPTFMDRNAWVNWEAAGSRTMQDRIQARLREILSTHKPEPLADNVVAKIDAILASAEARGG